MLPSFQIWGVSVSTYYLMMFIGFLVMLILMVARRTHYGLTPFRAVIFTIIVMFAGVLGCRILYILENIRIIIESCTLESGFSFFGAVFLVPLIMIPTGKLFGLSPGQSTDASAICVCAMVGTIRIGCFLNGCCGGKTLTHGFQWPTQLMESAGDFLILAWLLHCENQGKTGSYLRFLISYGILRFIIEFFRSSSEGAILDHAHFFSLLSIAIGLSMLLTLKELYHPREGAKRK